jgi:hypothetical protein
MSGQSDAGAEKARPPSARWEFVTVLKVATRAILLENPSSYRQLSLSGSLVNSTLANSMTCKARFWLDLATENIGEASI